jgi:hypothetical protein
MIVREDLEVPADVAVIALLGLVEEMLAKLIDNDHATIAKIRSRVENDVDALEDRDLSEGQAAKYAAALQLQLEILDRAGGSDLMRS